MNNSDIYPLELEIVRLNRIIIVLLEQIDQLKLNNLHLQKQLEGKEINPSRSQHQNNANNSVSFDSFQGIDLKQSTPSTSIQESDMKQSTPSTSVQESNMNHSTSSTSRQAGGANHLHPSNWIYPNGMKPSDPSTSLQGSDMNQLFYPASMERDGMTQLDSVDSMQGSTVNQFVSFDPLSAMRELRKNVFVSQEGMSLNEPVHTNSLKTSTENEMLSSGLQQGSMLNGSLQSNPIQENTPEQPVYLLPLVIQEVERSVDELVFVLDNELLEHSRNSTKLNVAKILVHIYNKRESSYMKLRKLTDLSEGGLGKLMILIRRKGLIHRTAYQQFAPTEKALQLMREARVR